MLKEMILSSKHDIGEQKFLDAAGFICGYFLTPKSKQRMLSQAGTSFTVPIFKISTRMKENFSIYISVLFQSHLQNLQTSII